MRAHWLWLLGTVGCGGGGGSTATTPASAVVEPAPVTSTSAAPSAVSLPTEPQGLRALAAPAGVCELTGRVVRDIALSIAPGGMPFATVSSGTGTLAIDTRGTPYLRLRLPSGAAIEGFTNWGGPKDPKGALFVYAKRWLSFGGVYFPGARSKLVITGTRDGQLLVSPGDDMVNVNLAARMGGGAADFELSEAARTLAVSCSDLSLEPDAEGALGREAPELFRPAGATKPKQMWLVGRPNVAVSPGLTGAPAGSFAAAIPAALMLLERRGLRARVRYEHVAGWIDAKALYPSYERALAAAGPPSSPEFGMIGLLNTGAQKPARPVAGRAVGCSRPVRIVAAGGAPPGSYIVGSIPAERSFHIGSDSGELTSLALDGVAIDSALPLTVPSRDLSTSCANAAQQPDAFAPTRDAAASQPGDAVEALDNAAPPDTTPTKTGVPTRVDPEAGARLGPPAVSGGPHIKFEPIQVTAGLPPEVVQRIVRQHAGQFRRCYEAGLSHNPALQGRVIFRFTIDASGAGMAATDAGSAVTDRNLVACVLAAVSGTTFPAPTSGPVQVVFPILFTLQ